MGKPRRPPLPGIAPGSIAELRANLAMTKLRGHTGLDGIEVLYLNGRLILRREASDHVLVDVAYEDLATDQPILEQLRELVRSVLCGSCRSPLLEGEQGLCIPCEAVTVKALLALGVDLQEE